MTEKEYSPSETFEAGTTQFPRVGGRRFVGFRCTVNLATGKADVGRSDEVDSAGFDDLREQISKSGRTFTRQVDKLPPQSVLDEIAAKVDPAKMEAVLMEEGVQKFADPQKALLKVIADKRAALK